MLDSEVFSASKPHSFILFYNYIAPIHLKVDYEKCYTFEQKEKMWKM